MDIADVKAALRREMRKRRLELGRTIVSAGDLLVNRYRAAARPLPRIAAVYSRMGGEIDPEPLALWLIQHGVEIALPKVRAAGQPLIFHRATAQRGDQSLGGVSEPGAEAEIVRPDLIFAPLLAFDRTGARLGQGGGYYDRTLEAYRKAGGVTALGLAYAGQETPALPVDAFDQRLDGVLTEAEFIDVSGAC